MNNRRIVVCADDYGMSPSVNAGILALAAQGRLSATSILVDGPAAAVGMPGLLETGLQLGLHLNLTESFGQPGLCLPLRQLILQAYARRLSCDQVQRDIQRQLQRFQDLTGRVPDYIDGHQHIHQLPGIRTPLLQALDGLAGPRPWIRHTGRPRMAGLPWRLRFKAWVIAGLGAAALHRQVQASGFCDNPGFLGVYDFTGGVSAYAAWMARWLAAAQDGDVLMCHPALGLDPQDALSSQRQAEYAVLAGAQMTQWLAQYQLTMMGARSPKEP